MWGFIVVMLVSALISYALMPRPQRPRAEEPKGDIDAPTAEEGRPIPVVFGTVLVKSSNVVWYGNTRVTTSGGGGRGGGGKK